MNNKFILFLFGKWWTYYSSKYNKIEDDVLRHCHVLYDVNNKTFIKNRWGDDIISDALKLKIWLEGDLEEYKYPGMAAFVQECHDYHMDLCK